MTVGGWNPCPTVVGGGTPPVRAIYNGLRGAVGGDRGAAGPVDDVEDLRRFATAFVVAAAAQGQESAGVEGNPGTSTYWIRLWESMLGLPREDVLAIAQTNCFAAFASKVRVDIPHLRDKLRAKFSSTIDIVAMPRAEQCITKPLRAYADRTGVVEFGPRRSAVGPAYASSWFFRVSWPGTRTEDEMLQISRYLSKALPSWSGFAVYGETGFVAGTSLLGQTAMTAE